MLLTIFNLPATTRYSDIKSLIHSKCGFKEVILDHLTSDGNNTKQVTVGLAEEEDAAILVRKINGLIVDGQQLYVETIKKKKQSNNQDNLYNQQLQSSFNLGNQNMHPKKPTGPGSMNQSSGPQQSTLQQPYYQQSYQQPNYQLGYTEMQQNGAAAMVSSMSYGMFDATQNAFANYGYPQQMPFQQSQMMVAYDHTAPLGFGNQGNNNSVWSEQNDWNSAENASVGNKVSQQSRTSTRWDNSGESNTHPRRDAPARDQGRDAPGRDRERDGPPRDNGRDGSTRNFRRDAPPRDFGRDGTSRDFGRDGTSRDFGRDANSRNFGRDALSRNLGRNAPIREGREGPSRSNVRGAFSRDHGRGAPSRDRGRDVPRNQERGASFRDRGRDAPVRDRNRESFAHEPNRDACNRRNEPNRGSQKRKFSSHDAPPPPLMSKITQNPIGNQTIQPWSKPQTKPAPNVPNSEGPPVKRMRRPPPPHLIQKTLARASTWRQQTTSNLAKEILNKLSHTSDLDQAKLLKGLKQGIRLRIEQVFGDNLNIKMQDMIPLYRKTYNANSDAEFFKEVIEEIKKNQADVADDTQKAASSDDKQKDQNQVPAQATQAKLAQPKPVQAKPAQAKPAQAKPAQAKPATAKPVQITKKPPSYSHGDKMLNKEQKKRNAMMFQQEDIVLSQIEPNMQKALNQEIDELGALVVEEFKDEPEPEFKMLHERAKTVVLNDIKKMLKVNFAKRILNVGPILVRIFCIPKMLNKTILHHALADYGVTSLRKSERKKPPLYLGTCDTYEAYDKLCSMDPIIVSGITVTIKPFHLTGKDNKVTRDQILAQRKNIKQTFENMGENLTADQEMTDENYEDYNQNDLTNLNIDNEENVDQGEDESAEGTEQQDIEKEANEDEQKDNNENVEQKDSEQECKENDTNENAESVDTAAVETEGNNEGTENNGNAANESNNLPSQVENTEVDSTQPENDFTTDVDFIEQSTNQEDSFKIDGGGFDTEADKELSELNAEDLEEISGRKSYDDIDIADLNDDDLEDW